MSSESCFPLKYVLAYQTQTDISAKKVPVLKCSPLTGMVGEVYEGSFLFWIGNCLGDNWLEVLKGFCVSEKREEGESGALLTSACKVKDVDAQSTDTDTDRRVFLWHEHRQERLTEDADVLVLLLPGPHIHAGDCFHVFSTRCCL